jgi:glycosyltransferase involved in cell wall biosynthesis
MVLGASGSKIRMKFLFTGNYLPDYNRTLIIKKGLQKLGHEIVEFPFEKGNSAVKRELLVKAAAVDVVFLPCFTQREIRFVRKVLPLAKIAYDPLISHYMTKIFDYKLASRWSLGAFRSFYRDKKGQAAADLVFTDTEAHRQYFHQTFGTPLEKMEVLYIGNNFGDFFPKQAVKDSAAGATDSAATPISVRKFRVGFYGGFIPLQGVMKILTAVKLLNETGRGADIEFDMVGNGFEYEKALAFIKTHRLTNVVTPGWVPYPQLRARLSEFDISLGIFGDGPKTDLVIPNKVYHYAGCGLPIITKDTPAIREIFKNNENALLTSSAPEAIADAILALKKDASLRERIGHNAFQLINSRYNEVKVAETLVAAIHRHLN